jgi:hypothetical protein
LKKVIDRGTDFLFSLFIAGTLSAKNLIKESQKMKETIEKAHEFYASEHETYGIHFSHDECIEEIYRIYGKLAAREVNNQIALDIPELGIKML